MSKLHTLIVLPLAIVAVGIITLLRPFLTIRIGQMYLGRIGGYYCPLLYLYIRKDGKVNKKCFDMFYCSKHMSVSNGPFLQMFKRELRFFPYNKLAHITYQLLSRFTFCSQHIINYRIPLENDMIKSIVNCKQPILSFTNKEEKAGQEELRKLGIPSGQEFICFFSRDAAYLNKKFEGKDWSYHDFRNTSIDSYIPSVEHLVNRGYYAVRMGSVVEEKLQTNNPTIIDYATNGHRSEFMDIYLSAKCKFYLGSDSGAMLFPETFKKPIIYTNWVSIQFLPEYHDFGLIILKKWSLVKEKRLLHFNEIYPMVPYQTDLNQLGVKYIDNTTEEMNDVIEEMEQRMNGTWTTTQEDEELQKYFWELYNKNKKVSPRLRIGAKFLRQHMELLGEASTA